jgi:acetyl-CoA C-acetyltransferase
MALRLETIPVSRVENMCATGTEALRARLCGGLGRGRLRARASASEKLKDTGYGGLPPGFKGHANDLWMPIRLRAAGFAQLAGPISAAHGTSKAAI